MSNSKCNIEYELPKRLTSQEYSVARGEIDDAIYWYKAGRDDRVRDFLICAISKLKSNGEHHAAKVVSEYIKFF